MGEQHVRTRFPPSNRDNYRRSFKIFPTQETASLILGNSTATHNHSYPGSFKVPAIPSVSVNKNNNIIVSKIAIDASCVLADLAHGFLSPTCGPPGEEGSPTWLLILSHLSLVITTLFLVEIPLSLWAFGLRFINPFGPVPHASLHAFDSLIIITTFVLEIILRGKERELVGLLVILRLWRLVKLVGGPYITPNSSPTTNSLH